MKRYPVTLLEVGLLSGTRAIAGVGLGLLLAEKLAEQRRPIGWAVFGVGAGIYIAMVMDLILRNRVRFGE